MQQTSLPSRRRVVLDHVPVELPGDEPLAVGAEGHVGGQIGPLRRAALRSPAPRPCSRRPPSAWCALTRVRPSGLNATSLTGLVSAVSGEPYGSPVFASHTKTDPSNDAAASSRPSGLRSSESAGVAADRERRPDRSSRCDVDHGHRAGVVARDQRSAALGEDRRPPRPRSRSRAACRPGAPSRPPRSRRSRERPGRRSASSPG